ncbi:hypothetical protein AABB24_022148 [Solanum stoloniferum]|uniref:U1-type domain-containing protein n=1 Tax=Solanum stoloniferum TaxID=62892 RepID=A0ABD2SYN3_9SOLN
MDYSGQYQQQQQGAADPSQIQTYDPSMYAQYPQQSIDPSQIESYDQSHYQQQQPADPSQIQPYNQSTQAYYAYQYNQQYYYPQDYYSNAYQQQQYQPEPTSIHPPGVPIPPSSYPYATQQQPQYSYYPQQQQQGINYGEVATVTMPNVSHTPAIAPSPYKGKGKRGGRLFRGGAHGHLGGGQQPPSYTLPTYAENQPKVFQGASQIQDGLAQVKPSSSASGNSAPVRPPRMAWCELCRIECNTPEVLEQHKNGKKHKKNLKAYEERQKLNKQMDGAHGNQTTNSEVKPRVSYQPAVEGSGQLLLGHLPSETVTGDRQPLPQEKLPPQAVIEEDVGVTGKQKVEETDPVDHIQGQGRGVKRNLRGGRGGKLMKTQNGSRKPAVPPNPQKMVPLICELCNVKCESVVVFQSHLAGRKHLSNVKDFQGQQAMVGQAALQALYPALQALYPALQALCQPTSGASTSVAPQGHQHNLHEILGILTQQALSAIPQDQLLGIGAAATSAIPQDQLLGIGAAVASAFPPPSSLLAQDHQGSKLQGSVSEETRENAAVEDGRNCDLSVLPSTESKPEESTDNKHENVNLEVERKVTSVEEPLKFGTSGDVSSTSGAVSAAVSVSNSEVVSSDCPAHSGLDGKLAD